MNACDVDVDVVDHTDHNPLTEVVLPIALLWLAAIIIGAAIGLAVAATA